MPIQLDLNKAATLLRLSLEKRGVTTPPIVEGAFDLDVSGSFEDEHKSGLTNDLMMHLVPWGLVFDPDKKLDVFTFSSRDGAAHYVGDVNATNYDGYVRRNIIGKVPGWRGGTEYAAVLRKNLQHFGWLPEEVAAPERGGFFSRMFGKRNEVPQLLDVKRRSLILFVTDGDNDDKRETEALLEKMERENMGVYILFIGVSNQGSRFPFLEAVANRFTNTGLYVVKDLRRFVAMSNEQLNEALITDELVNWLKA